MGRDRSVRRRRPVRAAPRSPRPARTAIVATLVVIAGAITGVGVANGDVTDAVASALGMRQSATDGSAGIGQGRVDVADGTDGADGALAPSAIGPITAAREAPAGAAAAPTPKVSVAPGLDMDLHSLDDPASPWVVVNKSRPLEPETWVPPELDSAGGAAMVPEASRALADMRAAAAEAGHPLAVGTGYRAYGFQQSIFADYAARWGSERADRFSARAGHSEHQTGWAVDVYGSVACRLKECFADEPAGQWVAQNGHEYGFVVRYPPGTEDITGYKHEPWHLRYVGVELATEMRERDVATMEEFFSLPAAPTYE
ncbi:M15 family metallopeptidase [Demequina sp. SO4-18]|uniref:M15 family metallopeptidase n=1 Tax=Demequina sp. SO4-18 TaxID=3401026 RepID=UPI003B5B9755